MHRVRGAPNHPHTQGKIERRPQTLQNRIQKENYYLPADLEVGIIAFAERYYHRRYRESLGDQTPADAYIGRARADLNRRSKNKEPTIHKRPLARRRQAA